ncbi:MAG: hypothetical protein KAW51_05165 [Candidatus Lokiarchaeota archaeon]|nr:hypothetical protein [Candidatus Lokiarchaeota archaeon]
MVKKEKLLLFLTSFLLFIVMVSYIANDSEVHYTDYNNINESIEVSTSLEGIENIIITKVNREVNISGYGLIYFEDLLEVKNLNNNPISSIFIGIPVNISDDLVLFEATGINQNTLFAKRSNLIMNEYEMIMIYFNSPLLPYQTRTIKFNHIYKNIISYGISENQYINISLIVFPLLPYKLEGEITALVWCPKEASDIHADWGFVVPEIDRVSYTYDFIKDEIGSDFITPFLENLGDKKVDRINYYDDTNTKAEMKEINREIFLSPWGILRVKDEFSIENLGEIDFYTISLKIPKYASNVNVFDDLGEILGVNIKNSGASDYQILTINLIQNRMMMKPNTTFNFEVEYNLPFENYVSLNWFQQSIQIDLLTTIYEYLGKKQTVTIIIDGCYNIDSITETPEAIQSSMGTTTLTYESDYVTPKEKNIIQFTFTIDLFAILLRPIIFTILFSLIASIYVLIIKTRKREQDITALPKEFIPTNEIRELCSLYEEKIALTLEIRQAKEAAKRKKMAKKLYKNILNKNTSKVEEIQKEITPFKKILMETSETFEKIVKRLDVLEAERISVKDSLALLESRYKRGRLPSRAAYLKLSDDFNKRRKKIDRTIDKMIQQLRSYLL